MRQLDRLAGVLAGAAGALGDLAVLLMFGHIAFDLVARLVFGLAPQGMPEAVARVYMVMVVFLPLALLERRGEQIEVSVLADRLPRGVRRAQHVAAKLLIAAVAGGVAWVAAEVAWEATQRGERVELLARSLPVWPARWAPVVGFVALAVAALANVRPPREEPRFASPDTGS